MSSSIRLLSLLILAAAVALSGCKNGFGNKKQEETETLAVQPLYEKAREYRDKENFARAQRYYERLISRFPFGAYTEQSQLDLAYSQYKQGKYEDATSTIDRFIRTYPTHPNIDYMYYLRGLVNFGRENFFLQKIARADMSARDLTTPQASSNDFSELIRRYPNSRYAGDSRQRLIYLRNFFAQHEIETGLYYYRRGAWVSAINRGKYILENYPQSQFQGDAVALLAASYSKLGDETLAGNSERVLKANYPEHPYLDGNWPRRAGLIGQLNPFGGGR